METILAIVEANKRVKLVNYIGNIALHVAAALGTPEIVHMMVREGANVNARNENEETPLHHTVWGDGSTRQAVISILLQAGADINAANNQLTTALHSAVRLSNSLCVKALLQAGADPSIADVMGETPREMALTRHLSNISSIFLEPKIVRPRVLALGQLSSRS
jgi:cytohesin